MEEIKLDKKSYLGSKMGEAVYLFCVRLAYRGIVSEVREDGVILGSPFMIFDCDSYTTEKVKEEYPIPSDLYVMYDAIEKISQPTWAFYGYEKKDRKEEK